MAVRDILGVYEDGSERDSRVPANVRVPLKMTQGSSLTVRLRVLNLAGAAVDLAARSASVYLAVKRHAAPQGLSADILVTGVLTPELGVNRASFALTPNNTKVLTPGRYVYDVWMVHTDGRDAIVPMSPFELEPSLQLP